MEKIINIDGRDVTFKTNGAVPLRYKLQFHRDFFGDIMKMQTLTDGDMSTLDLEVFYNIAWIFAKTADPTIPTPIEWLETFDVFPIADIVPEISDMLTACFSQKQTKN